MLEGISKVAVAVLLNTFGVGLTVRVALGMGEDVGATLELNIDWLSCHKTTAKMKTKLKATTTYMNRLFIEHSLSTLLDCLLKT